ncbi:uncharacterized protein LOC115083954 isoform X2 [Rhinatrema bivittatum]|uniref:uncharacterized protein LOC115083954 isoform X2 n=1 Tax=Rhinatrema bivittatum TaxID=194408 RepID=UPI001126EFBE|nr:uncharacterized protein LOC115083954 isoform X2 [Rhinatrema bivittatum]
MSEGSLPHWRTSTRSFHRQKQEHSAAASDSDTSSSALSATSQASLSPPPAKTLAQDLQMPSSTRSVGSNPPPPAPAAPPAGASASASAAAAAAASQLRDSNNAGTGRKRKANFSNEETETLVQHVVKHFSALYGSEALRTESTRRNQRRSQLWNQIQKHVNELGYTPRSIDDLKHKWRDLRLDVKRKITSKRSAGGGASSTLSPSDARLTPMEELVASTIGHHSSLDGEQDGIYLDPGTPRQSIFFQCRGPSGMCELSRGDRLNSGVLPRSEPKAPDVPAVSPPVAGGPLISYIGTSEEVQKEEHPDEDTMMNEMDIDIKTCPSTDVDIKPCPVTVVDIKPCPVTVVDIKPCPITVVDIKPCLTTVDIKPCPSTNVDIKPCLTTVVDIKPCPSTNVDLKPCLDTDIDMKTCPDPDISIKPCPDTWPPVEEDASAALLPGMQDVPCRCDSQGSMVSSPEDSLGQLSAQPDWSQEANTENPALGLLHGPAESLQLKEEEEEENRRRGGDSQEMEIGSLPGGMLEPPTWQERQEDWEQQSGSPQRSENAREDSLPSSASQEGDHVLAAAAAMPERADCSCLREERRTMWRTNMHRLLELEEQWDQLYHQELAMWEEERMQQREQRVQDRELQLQLLGVLTDIRDELKQLREQRAASREDHVGASSSGEGSGTPQGSPAAVEQAAIPGPSSPGREQPAAPGPSSPGREQPAAPGPSSPDQPAPPVTSRNTLVCSGGRLRGRGRSRGRPRIHRNPVAADD